MLGPGVQVGFYGECISGAGTVRAKAWGWDLSEEVRLAGMAAGELSSTSIITVFVQTRSTRDGVSVGCWSLPLLWSRMSIDFGAQTTWF